MTSLLGARRRADEFAAFVDGGGPAGTQTQRLAGVVTLLREHPVATPGVEFAAQLRDRLMTEAATLLTPENAGLRLPVRPRGTRERRLVAAASAVVIIGGTAGMAAAAQDALPGEVLYPIKRGIEQAQAELSVSPAGKGRDLLDQADGRLAEVRDLIADQSVTGTPQIPGTIEAFTSQARQGSDLLMSSFEQTRDPASINAVRGFAADGLSALQDLARTAPPDAQDALAEAASALTQIDREAAALCDTCGSGLPVLELPSMFLAAADVDRALRQVRPDQLDNSHPVIVPEEAVKKLVAPKSAPDGAPAGPSAGDSGAPVAPEADPPDVGLPTKEQVKKSDGDLGQLVDDTVDGLTGELDGLTTLLPDPTGGDGLLD
jgi:hypothetical protein